MAGKLRKLIIISFHSTFINAIHLEYCIQFWSSDTWEAWKNWSKCSVGPLHWGPGAVSLWGDTEGAGLVDPRARTALGAPESSSPTPIGRQWRRWSQALHSGRFSLDIRINLCPMRTLRPWHMPGVVVQSLSMLGSG